MKMSLHNSKKTALLQLWNCVSTSSISRIGDLASGEFFQSTIEIKFPDFFKEPEKCHLETYSVDHEDNDAKVGENVSTETVESVQFKDNVAANLDSNVKIKSRRRTRSRDSAVQPMSKTVNEDVEIAQSKDCAAAKSEVNVDSHIVNKEDKNESLRRTRRRDSIVHSVADKKTFPIDSTAQPLIKESRNSSCEKDKKRKRSSSVHQLSEEFQSSNSSHDEEILHRFKYIQKFIDDQYELKSDEMISYDQCLKSHELELAKVALFILSVIVNHFVDTHNEQLQTLSHLDIRIQEDIQECLSLFIFEKKKISRKEIEKLLSKHAKYKAQSPFKSPCETPQRSCRSKYRKESPPTSLSEEIFTNSPLKSFFESPIFKKEDIISKDKEIIKTKRSQLELELHCEDLQHELEEFKQQLQEKDKEIMRLKTSIDTLKETYETAAAAAAAECTSLICKEKEEKMLKDYKAVQVLLDFHREGYTTELTKTQRCLEEIKRLEATIKEQAGKLSEFEFYKKEVCLKQFSILTEQLVAKDNENARLKEELDKLKKREEIRRNESLYREKYSVRVKELKKDPQSPEFGENIGKLFEEEKERWSLQKKEHKEYLADDLSNSVEREKFRSSTEHLENNIELNSEDTDELLSLDSSDIESKQSVSSLPCEDKSPDLKETEAVLWKGLVFQPENESNLADVNSDSNSMLKEIVLQTDTDKRIFPVEKDRFYEPPQKISKIFERLRIALKRISSNGFCKIIDPLIDRLQAEYKSFKLSSINGSKVHDSEILLEKIIECIEMYVISHDVQDKGNCNSSTLTVNGNDTTVENTNEIVGGQSTEENTDKLVEEQSNELKKTKQDIYFLKKTVHQLTKQYQESLQEIADKNSVIQDLRKHSNELNQRLDEKMKKYAENEKKLSQLLYLSRKKKKDYELSIAKEVDIKKKCFSEIKSLQIQIEQLNRDKKSFGKIYKSLKEQYKKLIVVNTDLEEDNKSLKEDCKLLKEERNNLLERVKNLEMEKASHVCTAKENSSTVIKVENVFSSNSLGDRKPLLITTTRTEKKSASSEEGSMISLERVKKEELSAVVNSDSVLSEYNIGLVQENGNESVLSGALFNKSHLRFENQDEEDYLNHSSLSDIKNSVERMEELKRRNSMLPFNLQSSYPLENLTSGNDILYVRNSICGKKQEKPTNDGEFKNKKRKLNDVESDKDTKYLQMTPKARIRRTFKTPPSQMFGKLLNFRRRTGCIKPKP